ncbi:MAG: polysaccharide pyruvyl transferase family protein [Chloroflexi bacterium]|nr:MAG: polysaccharide pyruvyl transferase family protein [Chloroflexota bacterium]
MWNVSITGATLSGNKGAAAMLRSVLKTLPPLIGEVGFSVLSVYPDDDARLNDDDRVEIVPARPAVLIGAVPLAMAWAVLRWLHLSPGLMRCSPLLAALERSDLLIDLSGISFTDGRVVELVYNIVCILPALFLGKKVIKCSQAMGPFETAPNRWAARALLPKVTLNVARGQRTLTYLRELGLENIALCADVAFALPERESKETKKALRSLNRFGGRHIVGIAASSVVQTYCERRGIDYPQAVAGLVDRLTETGYGVWLIAHAVRKSRKHSQHSRSSDAETCQAVYDLLMDSQYCQLIVEDYSPATLRAIIGECSFFVASRFHAMVSSLVEGVPTIVTGWSHKYVEVLEMFDLGEWVIGHRELSTVALWEKFQAMTTHQDEIREKIARHRDKVVASARRNAELAASLLDP